MKRRIKLNETYHSNNYGDFIVIDRQGDEEYTIQFNNTGSITIASSEAIYHGRVKDKFAPNVAGVGFVGDFPGRINDPDVIIFYRPWNDMLHRCFNPIDKDYPMYGAIGVTVDSRWFNFSNFFEDAKLLPGYENKLMYPSIYCLDKDYLQRNIPKEQRIYSKDTCMWISKYDNITLMNRENSTSEYYGVTKRYNKYYAQYSNIIIDAFSDPIAAANAYNYYYEKHCMNSPLHTIHILNDVPYMPPTEFIKYNTNPKEMCKIVK